MYPTLPIAVGICILAATVIGFGMTLAAGKAVESVARQPEASGKINGILVLGLALAESCAIYGFVTGLIMMFSLNVK
jgi:F-type H+-transporting ATPase subunit c